MAVENVLPLEIGIPEIDADHRAILDAYLALARTPAPDGEGVLQAVTAMLNYSTEHLLREEGAMRLLGYPELPRHRKAHLRLQDALIQAIRPLLTGKDPGKDVAEFLEHHFLEHLRSEDAAFAEFASKHRAGPKP